MGQSSKGEKIKIERKAINLRKDNKVNKILKNKPRYQFVNLKLQKDRNSWISYNAGRGVCNFSMYVILDFIKNKNIKFAYLHIPKDFNFGKAIKFVNNKININKL